MPKNFWKFWRDPVVSGIIVAIVISEAPKIWGSHGTWWTNIESDYSLPLWLIALVAAVACGSIVMSLRLHFRREPEFTPNIAKIDQSASTAGPEQKLMYPLKCYIQFCNNSPKCVEVRIGDYKAKKVTLKGFVPNVLQIKSYDWVPNPDGVDRIGVLSGQIFRAWIGIDEKLFDANRVRDLEGQLGTLSLIVDGTRIPFEL